MTNAFQISEVKNKAKKNSHTPDAINKMLSTKKDHLGYSSPFENPEIQRKANKQSHTIYYPKGIEINGVTYYKLVEEFDNVAGHTEINIDPETNIIDSSET
mgnify:CR=1 FL=1